VSDIDRDLAWMQRALAEAERGRGGVEPNPLVGALVVKDGKLVAFGHHERFGGPHAEVHALQRAGANARQATLYVTLEPCCHHGKTPPCTEEIIAAGISRVVAAMGDPFPKVSGGGFEILRAAGIAVECGLGENRARRLNGPYLKRVLTGRPYVIAKWAMTLDGKTAVATGDSRWISNTRSRALVHERRGVVDAIAVGIETVLADDPELTARPPGPRCAARLILDSRARLPLESKLARSARDVPVLVAVTKRARSRDQKGLRELGCEILEFPESHYVPVGPLLDELGRRDITNLLVEGGGRVLGSFWDAGEIDELDAFIAPVVDAGSHGASAIRGVGIDRMALAARLLDLQVSEIAGDVRVRGLVPRPWRDLGGPATSDPSI
jgi:diaminohydroxyphosphoribosylaminopyrimidine deaminase/5-amino-6-(5-phosphoribosylamino)uracil reductase